MKLSAHFDSSEFDCKCGCKGGDKMSSKLITMLEQLHNALGAQAIVVTSGYRDPTYSAKVGGSKDDAHTRHMAADIKVKVKGAWLSSWDIAAAAERIGLKGIGIIDDTACHVDTRGYEPYKNSKWFGNEKTGETYSTFQKGGSNLQSSAATHTIQVIIDGKTVYSNKF